MSWVQLPRSTSSWVITCYVFCIYIFLIAYIIIFHPYVILFPSLFWGQPRQAPCFLEVKAHTKKGSLTNSKKAITTCHSTHDHTPITRGENTLGYENILMSMVKKFELILHYNQGFMSRVKKLGLFTSILHYNWSFMSRIKKPKLLNHGQC
jgi:hypothetical protein